MHLSIFRKITAVGLALAGILIALFWILHPETLTDPATYQAIHYLGLAGALLLPLGLVGVFGRLALQKPSLLGLLGFLLAFTSSLLAIGVSAADTLIWPAIAQTQPDLILLADGHFAESSPVFSATFPLIMVSLLLVLLGYTLLGVALWRGRVFSRPAIVLFVYAAVATAVGPGFIPHGNLLLNFVVYGPVAVGLGWLGLSLWQEKGAAATSRKLAAA